MLKKIAAIAALLSASASLSACETTAGKPMDCLPKFQAAGRCAKVPKIAKVPTPARPKTEAKTPQRLIYAPTPPRMNVYGQPI